MIIQGAIQEIWVTLYWEYLTPLLFIFLMLLYFVQRLREEMEEITQQQLVHDKYCKDLMGFSTKPRHITPFTSFQSLQPSQSNALAGLLGYSAHQGIMGFATSPVPAKSTLVESRCCRDLMEEKFDQVCVCSSACLPTFSTSVLAEELSSVFLLSSQCCLVLNWAFKTQNVYFICIVALSLSVLGKWFTSFGSSLDYPFLWGTLKPSVREYLKPHR